MLTSRILFTARQKSELWERWKNGQSVWTSPVRWKEEQDRRQRLLLSMEGSRRCHAAELWRR